MIDGFERIEGLSKRALKVLDDFIATLKSNYRYPSFVKSYKIEKGLNLGGSEVRALVHYHRSNGELIISTSKGYSWTDKPSEAESTINSLRQRSNSISQALNGMIDGVNRLKAGEQESLDL